MRGAKTLLLLTATLLLSIFASNEAFAQNEIRVNGFVSSKADSAPLKGVAVSVNDAFRCYTNVDGRFSLVMPLDAKISLSHPDCEDQSVMVDGQQEIKVSMAERTVMIDEVTVAIEVKRPKIAVEPTEMDVKGNYLHINTKYFVPTWLFKTDCRFVAQPIIEDRTTGITRAMRPVVIDGENYPKVQRRWLHFGEIEDPLKPYIVENNITKENNIYSYTDSVYIGTSDPNYKNEYLTNCYLALVSYNEPARFLDTITIARGVVNPVSHFDYSLEPMQLNESILQEGEEPYLIPTGADTVHIPAYEMKLQQLSGVAKIEFGVGSAKINYKDEATSAKLKEIQDFLQSLQDNPDATIKGISLCGFSSPEGSYAGNLSLAKKRTLEMQRVILSTVDKSLLDYIKLEIDSQVEPWSKVADLAEGEHPKLAAKIRDIVATSRGDHAVINYRVVRLPEYRKIIVPNYLDELRTVTYSVDYSIYMPLQYPTIRKMYDRGEKLSRYEYYTLIANEPDKSLLPAMEAAALKEFPNFTIVANRTAINLIRRDSANLGVLSPMIEKDAPLAVRYNQTIMAIKSDSLLLADSLSSTMNEVKSTEYLRNVNKVLSGRVDEAYDYFSKEDNLNKVVLLLAMKQNSEAYEIMSRLISDGKNQSNPRYCYIYAICANRTDNLNDAMIYLQEAITLDPSYAEQVKTDADLLDIYELLDYDHPDEEQ